MSFTHSTRSGAASEKCSVTKALTSASLRSSRPEMLTLFGTSVIESAETSANAADWSTCGQDSQFFLREGGKDHEKGAPRLRTPLGLAE